MVITAKRIRIVGLPPGEAPLEIRQAWIGLELPLAEGKYQNEQRGRVFGILSGPRTFFGLLGASILRLGEPTNSFVVESAKALAILEKERPEAAEWWKENAPHLYKPWMRFGFSADVCEEVKSE